VRRKGFAPFQSFGCFPDTCAAGGVASAHASASDRDGFRKQMKRCEEAQTSYDTVWNVLESHLNKHGC